MAEDLTGKQEDFVHAVEEVGISISEDQANGDAIGGYYTPHNQDPRTATRSSAREAYYGTVATRMNLHLITGQHVTRILTDCTQDPVTVTGVEVRQNPMQSNGGVLTRHY